MTGYVRMGTLVALLLQTAFILLDWFAYREHFSFFLSVRMTLNVVLALIYLRLSVTHPVAAEIALCLVMGVGMLVLIYGAGATEGGYYAGLILVFVGMGVMLPLTASQAAGICGVLLSAYVAAPLFAEGDVDWATFGLQSVFLAAAATESVASCAFLDRIRLTDFSQRRAIEAARDELRELDNAKSRFTSNVHHELRTPLTLVLAPLDALRGGDYGNLPPRIEEVLRTMYANGQRLLKLINNLLDLSKMESRQFEIRRRPVRLRDIVRSVIDAAMPLATGKGVVLSMEGWEDLPIVNCDPDAAENVVLNLVGNSLKFTNKGGAVVIRAKAEPKGIHLQVIDSGIGIPRDRLGLRPLRSGRRLCNEAPRRNGDWPGAIQGTR
jgi:signal transduction histidine kinase